MPELQRNHQEGDNQFKGQFLVEEYNIRDRSKLDKLIKEAFLRLGHNWKYVVSG